ISSLIGLLMGIGVMYAALEATTPDLRFFLDMHGILIVVGGTAAAASISFPINKVIALVKVFVSRVLGTGRVDFKDTIAQLLELNKKASMGVTALKDTIATIKHPFLREAVELVASGVLTEREIRMTLDQRVKTTEIRYMHEANMFRTI